MDSKHDEGYDSAGSHGSDDEFEGRWRNAY